MAELIDKNLALTTLEEVEKFAKEEGLEWANGIHRAIICIGAMQGSSEQEIRTKAIEEFKECLSYKIKSEIDDCADELNWIDEIAESMKGGKE